MKTYRSYLLLVSVVVLLGLGLAVGVSAQEEAYTAEITGVVEALTDSTITVDGMAIALADDFVCDPIKLQDRVQIHLIQLDDGTYAADQIRLRTQDQLQDPTQDQTQDPDQDRIQDRLHQDDGTGIVGTIEAVSDDTITVAGQEFDITDAEVDVPLRVGSRVQLHIRLHLQDGTGLLVVDEVVDADDDPVDDDDLIDDDDPVDDDDIVDDDPVDDDTTVGNCPDTLPAGWHSYRIQAGDTVAALALRTQSETRDLLRVNCLSDDGLIIAGAELYVPVEPSPAAVQAQVGAAVQAQVGAAVSAQVGSSHGSDDHGSSSSGGSDDAGSDGDHGSSHGSGGSGGSGSSNGRD